MKTIPEIKDSIKGISTGWGMRELYLTILMILIGLSSFGLGYLARGELQKESVRICDDPGISLSSNEVRETSPIERNDTKTGVAKPKEATQSLAPSPAQTAAASGGYVASKQGSKYHLPWCPGAVRIKAENQIWFKTKEEAEKAGYTPAANCKGL